MEESLEQINTVFEIEKKDASLYSPLILAYLGDSVYEVIIRTIVVEKGNRAVNILHKESTNLVKAATQAKIIELIKDDLNEKELQIFKRGRNTNSHTMAKNATMRDYRHATGLEALIGYLYLENNMHRALTLIKLGIDKLYNKNSDMEK